MNPKDPIEMFGLGIVLGLFFGFVLGMAFMARIISNIETFVAAKFKEKVDGNRTNTTP